MGDGRSVSECRHEDLACGRCGVGLARGDVAGDELDGFYRDLLGALEDLMRAGGSASGAAQVARRVARAHGVAAAEVVPLPRPTRAELEQARERRWRRDQERVR